MFSLALERSRLDTKWKQHSTREQCDGVEFSPRHHERAEIHRERHTMRISPSSIVWLAAASSAGIVRGAEVFFLEDGFTTVTQDKLVFWMSTISHTFGWFVNQSINAPQHTIAVQLSNANCKS
jgi:hypothetical protein